MIRAALIAVALALAAQAAMVLANYDGNWSGLYCVGGKHRLPPELPTPYLFHDSDGYDAQFYRLIAHDPLFQRGFASYIDIPRWRYNRILVPGLAAILSLGNDAFVEPAYVAVMLLFIAAGVYWSAQFAVRNLHRHPSFGLLFLALPATLIGLDRMTIDTALAALCVGYLVLQPGSSGWITLLAAAALSRETGFLLVATAVVDRLLRLDWRNAFLATAAAIPALLWYAYVAGHAAAIPTGFTSLVPLSGLVMRILHPVPYPFTGLNYIIVQTFDFIALLGAACAAPALWTLRNRLLQYPELIFFSIPFLFISSPDVWSEAYAFGRTMTPLWLFLALRGLGTRNWILCFAPVLLIDSQIGLQLATSQALPALKHLLH